MLNSFTEKIRSYIRDLGFFDAMVYFLSRSLGTVPQLRTSLHCYDLVIQPVTSARMLPAHRGANIEVVQVTAEQPERKEFPRPSEVIEARFSQGSQCLAAYIEGKYVGYVWFQLGKYQEDEVRCLFAPKPSDKTAWDYDMHIEEGHRHGIVFVKLWDELNATLTKLGITQTASRISAFNTSSLKAHARLGAKRVGRATFLSLGQLQISLSTIRPRIHISRGNKPTGV